MATTQTRAEDDWRQFWLVPAPPDLRRCQTCGRIGREGVDVSTTHHWVGGVGHELRTYCRDVPSCFARREGEEK